MKNNFEKIVENTFDAIFVNDAEGNYLYVNRRAAELSGYTKEELLSKNIVDLTPSDRTEQVLKRIKNRLIGKEKPQLFDTEMLHKSGKKIPVEITGAVLRWDGKPAEMVSLRDISERKKLEQELKHLSRFQELLLSLGERFLHFPLEKFDEEINNSLKLLGEFLQVDRVYLFDYDFEKDTMSNTYEWCAPGIEPEIENLQNVPNNLFPEWVAAHKQGTNIHIPSVKRLPDGSPLKNILQEQDIQSLITVPLILQKECIGFVGFDSVKQEKRWSKNEIFMLQYFANLIVGVMERVKAEQALINAKEKAEESDRIKSAFLATISHELRTPLNAIIGFSELIDEEMPLEMILEYVKIINQSGGHLLEMINNVFDLSLLAAGEMNAEPAPFKPVFVVDKLKRWSIAELNQQKKENIEINWNFSEEILNLTLFSDQVKLTKLLKQLISNAIKFTPKGKITIGAKKVKKNGKDQITFSVADTGVGIPKEKQDIIFDIFSQADNSSTRLYGGMGMGLTLAKELAELLNGTVSFKSETEKGSTFYVTIPVKMKNEN